MRAETELIAFDLDGTLVDSAPDLARAVDHALEHSGLPPPGEALTRGWIGDGVETLVSRALENAVGAESSAELFDNAFAAFSRYYLGHLFVASELYAGAAKTLQTLSTRGYTVCCVTNKRLRYTESLLQQAGILEYFDMIVGGDSLERKKPHPAQLWAAADRVGIARSRSLLVGDSVTDRDAANAAGFGFIWAAYGYGKGGDLSGESTTRIDRLTDLLELL